MRPSEVLPQHRETIRQLVLEAGMANPRAFGSVLRGENEEDSDLDLLVDPAPRTSRSIWRACKSKSKREPELRWTC
jgi:predicted nucleotidyltransferase